MIACELRKRRNAIVDNYTKLRAILILFVVVFGGSRLGAGLTYVHIQHE